MYNARFSDANSPESFEKAVTKHMSAIFPKVEFEKRLDLWHAAPVMADVLAYSLSGRAVLIEAKFVQRPRKLSSSIYPPIAALGDALRSGSDNPPLVVVVTNSEVEQSLRATFGKSGIALAQIGESIAATRESLGFALAAIGVHLPEVYAHPKVSQRGRCFISTPNTPEGENALLAISRSAQRAGFEPVSKQVLTKSAAVAETQHLIRDSEAFIGYFDGADRDVAFELGLASATLTPFVVVARRGAQLPMSLRAENVVLFDDEVEQAVPLLAERLFQLSARDSDRRGNIHAGWFEENARRARAGLEAANLSGFMEVRFAAQTKLSCSQIELLNAARAAEVHTFGWPIGITLENRPEFKPRPLNDGIRAEVSIPDNLSFDYWSLRKNGDFYLMQSFFEDKRSVGKLFFNTRIVRVTEALMYAERLYARLGLDSSTPITAQVTHGGLRNRVLASSNWNRDVTPATCYEDEAVSQVTFTLNTVRDLRPKYVEDLLSPVFLLFEFMEFNSDIYRDIVDRFESGEVS